MFFKIEFAFSWRVTRGRGAESAKKGRFLKDPVGGTRFSTMSDRFGMGIAAFCRVLQNELISSANGELH
jgi:hypothetical protein